MGHYLSEMEGARKSVAKQKETPPDTNSKRRGKTEIDFNGLAGDGLWYWRAVASNGKCVAVSGAYYDTVKQAVRAAGRYGPPGFRVIMPDGGK
jgi:hypothetical protein